VSSTASIGLTISRPGETNIDLIVRRADMALYRAKHAGRSCVRVVLGDPDGNPIGTGAATAEPISGANATLPFPDRRNPARTDRRRVPGPGRRSTDVLGRTQEAARSEVVDEPRHAHGSKQSSMPSLVRFDTAGRDE
jgi:hypothetical protein